MTKQMEGKRVITHAFGPATLVRFYEHRDTKEMVFDVVTDNGERLYLSQSYVNGMLTGKGASR